MMKPHSSDSSAFAFLRHIHGLGSPTDSETKTERRRADVRREILEKLTVRMDEEKCPSRNEDWLIA